MAYIVGVVGLGVMGANLALNMERNGFAIVGHDLDLTKAQAFLQGPASGRKIAGADSPAFFMQLFEKPRRIPVMVPAGAPVDSAITHLKPHLDPGDILMDGGNSYFLATEKRSKELEQSGFLCMGVGVSGGEEGALWGPATMPGGQREAWDAVAPILCAIAARAEDGQACVEHLGPHTFRRIAREGVFHAEWTSTKRSGSGDGERQECAPRSSGVSRRTSVS